VSPPELRFLFLERLGKGRRREPSKIAPRRRGNPATAGFDSRTGRCVASAANGFAGLPQPAVRKPVQEKSSGKHRRPPDAAWRGLPTGKAEGRVNPNGRLPGLIVARLIFGIPLFALSLGVIS